MALYSASNFVLASEYLDWKQTALSKPAHGFPKKNRWPGFALVTWGIKQTTELMPVNARRLHHTSVLTTPVGVIRRLADKMFIWMIHGRVLIFRFGFLGFKVNGQVAIHQ